MAEKKVQHSDIFADDLFLKTQQDAEKFLHTIQGVKGGIKELLAETRVFIEGSKFDNSKDLEQFIKKTTEAKEAIKQLNAVEKVEQSTKEKLKSLTDDQIKQNETERLQRKTKIDAIKTEVKLEQAQEGSINKLLAANKKLRTERDSVNRSTAEGKKRIAELNTEINKNTHDINENTDELIQNKINVGNYKSALKDLKKELAGLDPGTERFRQTAEKAGELKDRIDDANAAVNNLATGSKGEAIVNLFGEVGEKVKNLDFEGAAQNAKLLSETIKSISFKEIVAGAKNLGSTFVSLAGAFLNNPFALVTGAVVGLVFAFVKLNEAIGDDTELLNINNEARSRSFENISKSRRENKALTDELLAAQGKITDAEKQRRDIARETADQIAEVRKQEAIDLAKQKKIIDDQTKARKNFNIASSSSVSAVIAKAKEDERLEKQSVERLESFALSRARISRKEIDEIISQQILKNELINQNEKNALEKSQENKDKASEKSDKKEDSVIEKRKKKELDEESERRTRHETNLEQHFKREKDILEKQKIIFDAATKEQNDRLAHLDELQKKFEKEKEERRRKEINEAIANVQFIEKLVFDSLNRRSERERQALNEDISLRDENIKKQQSLAERGLENTLAFEEKKRSEDELKKEQLREKDERRAKVLAYLNAVIEYAKQDPNSAPFKALATVAIAEAISGAFKDGVEGFKGKGSDTSDSNLVLLSNNESVITAKGTRENTGLATAMNEGKVKEYFIDKYNPKIALDAPMSGVNWGQPNNNTRELKELSNKLDVLNNTLRGKKEMSINWNNHGEMTVREVENGVRRVINYAKKKPKI